MILLDELRKAFTRSEDQAIIKAQENRVSQLERIQEIMKGETGDIIKNWLIDDVSAIVKDLIQTRDEKFISQLEAKLDLINKLKTENELDAIQRWAESKLAE